MKKVLLLGLAAGFLIFFVSVAGGSSIIAFSEKDSTVRTDYDVRRNDNMGGEDHIQVGTSRGGGGIPFGGADAMRSLIQFDLSWLAYPVEEAILELTLLQIGGYGSTNKVFQIDVHKILDPWIEGNGGAPGVNYDDAYGVAWEGIDPNNQDQPNFAPTSIASTTIDQSTSPNGSVIQWDITALANEWYSQPASNFGLLLRDPTSHGDFRELYFASSDNTSVSGPRLLITAIPEPATYILFGLGLIGIARIRKRRR